MVAVNAARADFADDDGLPRPAVLADFLEFLRQTLRHGRVVIPLRIDVHAHHVAVAIDAAAGALQERGGHRAGRVQVVQERIDFAIAVRAVIAVVRALVQAAPDENGRVIAVLVNHFAHALPCLRHEVRVAHLLFLQAARVRLLPHQQPHFVAEVKEARVIGVVAGAHAVAAHVLHHQDVLRHGLQRHRAAERAVLLVAVEAHQAELLAVEQQIHSGNADFAEADAVNEIIQHLISFADFSAEGVKCGRVGRPRGHIRIMRIGNADDGGAVRRDVRGLGERLPGKGEGDIRRRVVIRQIADVCGNIRRPAVRRALRRDTDTLHKHVRQLLDDDRARDAAIRIVVIRNVQGGILPETVVHLDGQRMFAVGQAAHDCLKRGERAVVPGDFIAIQQDACAEGHAAEGQADIAPAANAGRVVRAPAVVVERWNEFPCAGDGQPRGDGCGGVEGSKVPQRRDGNGAADLMGGECAVRHRASFLPADGGKGDFLVVL